jgi:DNA end-binding protein Ku
MAPKAQWNGYLKLSLVSCPISLFSAVSAAERVSFRQVNTQTGNRLRQQLVDTVTGQVVEQHQKGRGYEVAENQFLVVKDEELEEARQEARDRPFGAASTKGPPDVPDPKPSQGRLRVVNAEVEPTPPPAPQVRPAPVPRPVLENPRTIELYRFIPRAQIDPRYYSSPYYIAPRDEVGLEAFSVIRDAMERQALVGMGRIVLANRERPLFIEPMGLGLRAIVLRYAHEVRSEVDYFADIPPIDLPEDIIELTEHILNTKREDFDPAYLEDRYRTVLVEKLRQKRSFAPTRQAAAAHSAKNVINLMTALKASLGESKPPASSKPKAEAERAVAPAKAPARPVKKRRPR